MKTSLRFAAPILLLVIALFSNTLLTAQEPDSLLIQIENENDAVKKMELRNEYANKLSRIKMDSSMEMLDAWIDEYEKAEFLMGVGRMISLKAWFLVYAAEYEESLRLGHQALKIQEELKDEMGIALTQNRIGVINLQFERYDDSRVYLEKALDAFIKINDTTKIDMMYNNLGVLAGALENPKEALDYYKQSLALRLMQNNHFWIAYSYYNIAETFKTLDEMDSVGLYMTYALETFKNKTEKKKVPAMVYGGLAEWYALKQDYTAAIDYINKSLEVAEADEHVEVVVSSTAQLSSYLFESGRYKEAYEALERYSELKDRLDSTNNLARVAEIEEQYENVKKAAQIDHLQLENQRIENEANRLRLVAVTSVLLVLLIALTALFFYLRKRQKEKIENAEFSAQLAQLKLTALKSQMNPHFVFNCINTAQHFIMNADQKMAYEYLSMFADLLRKVLDNSGKTFLLLEDELNLIRSYIELESIRFDQKFDYQIEVDEELENGVFEIPGMILQPFIENAILHGLVNRKAGGGHLAVSLQLKEQYIACAITDNGVGREKARAIKAQKKVHYSSAAIPNVKERLQILEKNTNIPLQLQITDLKEGGKATGTTVLLQIPYQ